MDRCIRWSLSHSPDAVETAKAHEALKADPVLWDQLAFTGLVDAGHSVQEQRTCPACASSLCMPVDAARIDRLLSTAARLVATSMDAVQSVRQRPPLPVLPVSSENCNSDAVTTPFMATDTTRANPVATARSLARDAA